MINYIKNLSITLNEEIIIKKKYIKETYLYIKILYIVRYYKILRRPTKYNEMQQNACSTCRFFSIYSYGGLEASLLTCRLSPEWVLPTC